MNKLLTLIGAFVLVAVFGFYMCTFEVRFTEVAFLKTFGKYTEKDIKTEPGLYRKWPWPFQMVEIIDNRLRLLEDAYEETTTRDSQNVMVTTFSCWKVDQKNPYKFHIANRNEADAESKLRNLIQAQKKIVVAQHDLADFVNTDLTRFKFEQIEKELLDQVAGTAREQYGIDIQATGIRRLSFPKSVTEQIFARMKTREEEKAAKFRTEGEAMAQDIRARASAISRNILAVADRLAKEIRADAQAEVGEYYKEFEQNVELRLFLDRLEASVRALKERSTLIMSDIMAPFGLIDAEGLSRPDVRPALGASAQEGR